MFRMPREDLMRISRALALFRPSFIALIMNLTEEDLVFMEKCLQRTLLVSFNPYQWVAWHVFLTVYSRIRNMKS
jgi:hypothetical protein